MSTPIRPLNIGLESVSRWRVDDEAHLPQRGRDAPKFLPKQRELDEILHRPSLDERLTELLQPSFLDTELLHPNVLSDTRLSTHEVLGDLANEASGDARQVLSEAQVILGSEMELEEEVRAALAALLKG
ncbi:hypothetical protein C8N35_111131 [Breoghania corrubedonensis]|uniref:Uncharacterized protein n=1 Tax=Breoghania corrubedonensis TaxID=665038 RepID=A0A2T5UYS8_9HYPH|nr:hypothetical protein [Breoghania corrubedonensis]PTW56668.1 hypothetical protein C8N35_111131 [Breoghania corrubedonensis]